MKLFKNCDKRIVSSGIVVVLAAVLGYSLCANFTAVAGFLKTVKAYLSPVIWGLVVAYLLSPFANFMERLFSRFIKSERLRRNLACILALLLLLILILLVLYAFLPQIIDSLTLLSSNFDRYVEDVKGTLKQYAGKITFIHIEDADIDRFIGSSDRVLKLAGNWAKENIDLFINLVTQLSGFVVNFLIVIAMGMYALLDRKNLKRGAQRMLKALLGPEKSARVNQVANRGDLLVMNFLSRNSLDALIIGVVNFIFLGVVHADYQLILAVMLGVTNFIPTFGPIIGGVLGGVVILFTKPDLLLIFILFTIILQQIDGNIIKPLLFGSNTGLSSFWVLVAIVVGGKVFGLVGMILGVPFVALISSLLTELLNRKLPEEDQVPITPPPPRRHWFSKARKENKD